MALDYQAAPACPSRSSFRDRVEGRTDRARFVLGGQESKSRAVVKAELTDDGARAVVEVDSPSFRSERRVLSGATCMEVVDASALLVAVFAESLAAERDQTSPPVVPAVAPPPPAPPAWRGEGYVHGGMATGLGPEAGPLGKLGLGIEHVGRGFAPSFRLEGRFQSAGQWQSGDLRASFSVSSVALDACPVSWVVGAVSLRPCLALAGGNVLATASGFPDARDGGRLYAALEAGGRGRLALSSAFVEVDARAVVPSARHEFVMGGTTLVHRMGTGASASLGAGLHFW